MGKSQLDKLGALTHARRYTHTHTRPRTPHSAYVIKCAVKFALGARVHSYLSPWQLRRGDCNRTISRGSWEISLEEWALLRNGGGEDRVRERETRRAEQRQWIRAKPFVCGDVNKIFDFVCLPHVRILNATPGTETIHVWVAWIIQRQSG